MYFSQEMHVSVYRLSLLLCSNESWGNICSMEAVLTFMISQWRAFVIFSSFFPESVPWFTAGTFNVTKRKPSFCMRRVYKQVLLAYKSLRLTCLSNLSDGSVINDCMIQPSLKEVRISYKLDKYRFIIICYINLFNSLQPKAVSEWTV